MMLRSIILSFIMLNSSILLAQGTGYFSKVLDLGYEENNTRFRWLEKGPNDIMYGLGYSIDILGNLTSFITKLNEKGEVIKINDFSFAPGSNHNIKLYNDTLYVLDVINTEISFEYRITRIDTSLNLIDENYYRFDSIVQLYADSDIAVNEKQIGFVGCVNKGDVAAGIIALVNRQTMELDTSYNEIIGPYDNLQRFYKCGFDSTGDLNVFFSARTYPDLPGVHYSFGIIQINTSFNLIIEDFDSFHQGLGPIIAHFNKDELVYRGRATDYGPLTYRHTKINVEIDTIWIMDNVPGSYRGATYLNGYSQAGINLFAFGEREWHFGYNGTDFPAPANLDEYTTAYLLKINDNTGSKEWGRTYVEFNDLGNVNNYFILGMSELDNGDLFCVGGLAVKDAEGRRIAVKPWVMKLPPDGCYLGDCEGMESFLSTSDDIIYNSNPSLEVFPNPVENQINIKDLVKTNYRKLKYSVSTVDGQLVKNAELHFSSNGIIDFSNLASGIYFLNIIDTDQKETYTYKIIKK